MMSRIAVLFSAVVLIGLVPARTRADLIAYYAADGNANDSVGGHDGTMVNGAGFAAGKFGQAFALNGVDQYVSVPDSPAWNFGNNPFTISLWANFASLSQLPIGNLPNTFIGQDEGGGQQNKWVFYYDAADARLAFHINQPATPNIIFLTSPSPFTPGLGQWHLYSVTSSGGTYTFYADGVSLGTASSPIGIPDVNAPLAIGEAEGQGFPNGRLDDVRIYNRALSASEIAGLHSVPEPSGLLLGVFGVSLAGSAQFLNRIPLWRRDVCPQKRP
jgi:hypothetical protein